MTRAEIVKKRCSRCGRRPGRALWDVCADRNRSRVLCLRCDISLNNLVLRWAGDPRRKSKMTRYRRRMTSEVFP